MINLNISNELPKKLKWYALIKVVLGVFLVSFPFLLFNSDVWFSVFMILIFVSMPVFLYTLFYYSFISFVVEKNKLTINSGIIIKKSKSIAFDKVQNISNVRGLLCRLFGLSLFKIWTASPSQIKIGNEKTEIRPDGALWLDYSDSEWLRNFILDKHS